MDLILDRGADVNQTNQYSKTALMLATQNGHFEVVRLLLYRGADVNQASQFSNPALTLATQNGHLEVVRLLLD